MNGGGVNPGEGDRCSGGEAEWSKRQEAISGRSGSGGP